MSFTGPLSGWNWRSIIELTQKVIRFQGAQAEWRANDDELKLITHYLPNVSCYRTRQGYPYLSISNDERVFLESAIFAEISRQEMEAWLHNPTGEAKTSNRL